MANKTLVRILRYLKLMVPLTVDNIELCATPLREKRLECT